MQSRGLNQLFRPKSHTQKRILNQVTVLPGVFPNLYPPPIRPHPTTNPFPQDPSGPAYSIFQPSTFGPTFSQWAPPYLGPSHSILQIIDEALHLGPALLLFLPRPVMTTPNIPGPAPIMLSPAPPPHKPRPLDQPHLLRLPQLALQSLLQLPVLATAALLLLLQQPLGLPLSFLQQLQLLQLPLLLFLQLLQAQQLLLLGCPAPLALLALLPPLLLQVLVQRRLPLRLQPDRSLDGYGQSRTEPDRVNPGLGTTAKGLQGSLR